MSNLFFDILRRRFKRVHRVVNPADPTSVVRWTWHPKRVGAPRPTGGWRFGLDLVASWGVEARVSLFGRTWQTYDNRFFCWLHAGLEDAHDRHEAQFDEDPMGRIGDYI
jgi:hypothetical protein